jgi:uroporphyrin-III C-methyltransferase
MRRLGEIAGALLAAGMSVDTPCAAIESATRPEQRHVLAPLGEFAEAVARAGLGSPAIVVIGGVASLALARDAAKRDGGVHHEPAASATRHESAVKTLSVGIGCRLHSDAADIEAAVRTALGSNAFEQIGNIATIDSKANEAGLLEFCSRHQLALQLFSREQIAAVPVASPSAATRAHVGVDGVCEPCALLAAAASNSATTAQHARLVVRKTTHAGITVAIATANDAARSDVPPFHSAPQDQDPR